jgi:hypothetical protein
VDHRPRRVEQRARDSFAQREARIGIRGPAERGANGRVTGEVACEASRAEGMRR